MRLRAVVRALVCGAAGTLLLPAAAAFAQGSPAPEEGGPPWTYYMAYGTIAIAGVTLLMFLLGYLAQSKGLGGLPPQPAPGRRAARRARQVAGRTALPPLLR